MSYGWGNQKTMHTPSHTQPEVIKSAQSFLDAYKRVYKSETAMAAADKNIRELADELYESKIWSEYDNARDRAIAECVDALRNFVECKTDWKNRVYYIWNEKNADETFLIDRAMDVVNQNN